MGHAFSIYHVITFPASTQKYYQRGNTWEQIPGLNVDPEGKNAGSKLNSHLEGLKDKYEVKLEKENDYKARPTSGDQNITVTEVNPDAGNKFKGFKHDIPERQRINRITIHGYVTNRIENSVLTSFPFSTGGGVFVYFEISDTNNTKPLLICLSDTGSQSSGNKWYKRISATTWQLETTGYESINPGPSIDDDLKQKLEGIKTTLDTPAGTDKGYTIPKLIVKLDYAAKSTGTSDTITYRTGDKQVIVTPVTQQAGVEYRGFKHDVGSGTIDNVKIHGNGIREINATVLAGKQYVYVYYDNNDTELKKPYLICLQNSDGSTKTWYKRTKNETGGYTWNPASEFGSEDPDTITTAFTGKLSQIKSDLNPDTGYTSPASIDIDATVTPTDAAVGKEALYGIGSNQIKVSKLEGSGSNGVPQHYVRYKHEHTTSGTTFNLSSVKHNDQELKGIVTTPTQGVRAVYVYYRSSGQDDPNHEFPLIVCVKKSATDHPYYKRGNTWTEDSAITDDPDTSAAGQTGRPLATTLGQLKDKYEIKLEVINTTNPYKGSPQSTTVDITVGTENVGNFKGYSHYKTGIVMEINRITHYGRPIGRGIPELDKNLTIEIATGNKVWVFYQKGDSNRDKPLLLYFKKNGATASNNWYGKGKKWELHKHMKDINASDNLPATDKPRIASKLNAILRRWGGFKELKHSLY